MRHSGRKKQNLTEKQKSGVDKREILKALHVIFCRFMVLLFILISTASSLDLLQYSSFRQFLAIKKNIYFSFRSLLPLFIIVHIVDFIRLYLITLNT